MIPDELKPLAPRVDEEVASLLRLGLVRAEPVAVGRASAELEAELDRHGDLLRARYAGRAPAEIGPLSHARDLYKAFGIDPTRTRPSSEALLRRVLKGKPLPRILNAVDVCNLCSIRFLLPIGLYDVRRLRPPVTLRRGRSGESYPGIRKDDVHLRGRPVLVDTEGPFGNPTSDSMRSSVQGGTRALLMVIFAPAFYPEDRLTAHVRDACESMRRHLAPSGQPVSAVGAVP